MTPVEIFVNSRDVRQLARPASGARAAAVGAARYTARHVISYPWPEPPLPGGVIRVARGIWWLRMPLPFKLDHINLWLLEDDDGWTVVDAGIGLEDVRALWDQLFGAAMGGRPIRRLVITHFHPDHMGNAEWLARRFGIDVWCAQAEWLVSQLAHVGGRDLEQRLAHYRRNGVAEEAVEQFRTWGDHYPHVVPSVPDHYRCLREGDVLAIGGREWSVMTVFGHSPEQVTLQAGADILISGDEVLPRITSNVSVWSEQPLGNPLRLYLESIERYRPLAPDTLVLPSHNLPFRGLHERLDQLQRHHAERLDVALAALDRPRSGAEIVPVLFAREMDLHQLGFAIGEALAHLHYLEWQGRARRIIGADGVHRFQRA